MSAAAASRARAAAAAQPSLVSVFAGRKGALTAFVMMAMVMQVLDTTIANVALPYMQGGLSATLDQVNWVLTSYIVAAAIMTGPVGWLSARFGRKQVFVVSIVGFTIASMLCGAATTIGEMVMFRVLQGVFGAALAPLSQAVMIDGYPPEQRGAAMAIWGMGVMLGPILGPTLGGWLTETWSWRWVFYVNVPVGVIATLGLLAFMDETEIDRERRFDGFGFLALSVGLGAMQLMLDRGQQLGWFSSGEIRIEAIVAAAGFYYFIAHSITARHPFIPLGVFADINFVAACVVMFVVGILLLATVALIAPFVQHIMGYPVIDAGVILGTRGFGTMAAMMIVGRLVGRFDGRMLILFGMICSSASLLSFTHLSADTSPYLFVWMGIVQGFGLGFIFVPLNTIAYATMPAHLRTDATAVWSLVRNLGSAVGVSIVIAQLTSKQALLHTRLVEAMPPLDGPASMATGLFDPSTDVGRAVLDGLVSQQAAATAYSNDFLMMTVISLLAMPLLLVIRGGGPGRPNARGAAPAE